MPPIHDQSEANWCYAFAACDFINYNIHLAEQQQNPAVRYLAEREVSVIDAIDPARNGDAMNREQALQVSVKVRTQAQVPFHSAQAAGDGAAIIQKARSSFTYTSLFRIPQCRKIPEAH